jgi:hypothetical protein
MLLAFLDQLTKKLEEMLRKQLVLECISGKEPELVVS